MRRECQMTTRKPRPDPPVRRNGRCAVCNGQRPALAIMQNDPFCSNTCCRIYHEDKPDIKEAS